MADSPAGESSRVVLPSQSRGGCPCCAFDLFLPESVKAASNNKETSERHNENKDDDLPCSPQEALIRILNCAKYNDRMLLLIDTHGHAQLDRDRDETYAVPDFSEDTRPSIRLISLTCAVDRADWKATLDYASSSDSILPALGIHPWYVENLPENWLGDLEMLLRQHASAIVGEIGLCKKARFVRQHPEGKAAALAIQRSVFKEQMRLAAKLRRPVSVHCVDQHGINMDILKELVESNLNNPVDSLPLAIGMHSFTGTAHHVRELLTWEQSLSLENPPLLYFGFSHAVNFRMQCSSDKSRRKGLEAVRAVPLDRILAESDVHSSLDLHGGTCGGIAYIAWARNASIEEMVQVTSSNALAFLSGVIQSHPSW
jgi:Tat protein secretion system quality control protein TatD with DNase activity